MKRVSIVLFAFAAGVVIAQPSQDAKKDRPSAEASSSTLDQMIASGKNSKELAEYVFDTHGCKGCHTLGHDGKLGFTAKGKERAQGFEGCINMLTAMTVIVQVPEDRRSPQQRQKAERFEEFGCTACHKLTPGKLGLTEVGAKLAHLHLGCVEVEKLTSSGAARQD
jgi:cytochrome c551/c552